MARTCARPGCSSAASATFNFDGLRRVVWIAPLDEAQIRSAGDLCTKHADRLKPPRQWELRDSRNELDVARAVAVAARSDPDESATRTPLLSRAFRSAKAG